VDMGDTVVVPVLHIDRHGAGPKDSQSIVLLDPRQGVRSE